MRARYKIGLFWVAGRLLPLITRCTDASDSIVAVSDTGLVSMIQINQEVTKVLQNGAQHVYGPFRLTITLSNSEQPLQLEVNPHDTVHARVVRILLFASLHYVVM